MQADRRLRVAAKDQLLLFGWARYDVYPMKKLKSFCS
jgi:hypothetical protein